MKLIKPSTEIRTQIDGERILLNIEVAARTCYKSEERFEADFVDINGHEEIKSFNIEDCNNPTLVIREAISARKLIKNVLLKRGHHAMIEFGGMINVLFVCDRGVSHELVRHRLPSFAQESTRYCNYAKNDHVTFVIPPWINLQEGEYASEIPNKDNYSTGDNFKYGTINWYNSLINAEFHYLTLINVRKWNPQQARSVLPNSLKTEINVSCNIREWRHIFEQRCSNAAHPQMQELMRPLLAEFQQKIPILFDDITY